MELSYYLWSLLPHMSFLFELIGTIPIPTQPTCTENLFMCKADKQCIPSGWVCDYSYDCDDKSDEFGCHSDTTTTLNRVDCKENEFMCQQDNFCIPMEWVCDKAIDCIDNSDEINCTATECKEDEVRCRLSGHCIKKEWICDGESDCIDNSDEEKCTSKSTTTETTTKPLTTKIFDHFDLASFIQSHNIKMFFPIDSNDLSQKKYPGKQIHSIYFKTSSTEPIIKLATDASEEQPYTTLNSNSSSIESKAGGIFVKDEISYNAPIFFTFANNNYKIDEDVTSSRSSGDDMSDSYSEVSSITTDTTKFSNAEFHTNQTELLSATLSFNNLTEEDISESISVFETDTESLTTTEGFPTVFSTTNNTINPTETIETTILQYTSTSSPVESFPTHTIATTTLTPTTNPPTTTKTTPTTTPFTTTTRPSTTTTTYSTTTTSTSTRATTPYPCRGEEFFCFLDQTCIPVEWRCDLTKDCWDGSDERNCDLVRCPDDMIQCEQSGQCIFSAWLCDGARDCEDGSDERGC